MNMKIVFIMIFTCCLLAGCWDSYELEERANILGLAIDIADKQDIKKDYEVTHLGSQFFEGKKDIYYKVTAQIALPGKIKLGPEGGGGDGSEKTAWIIETYGYTMRDAIANLQQQLAERIYLGHLQIIVISEAIANRGLSEINDFLRRDQEVRRTAWMAVNGNNAAEVLNAAPPVETVPSLYLAETLDNAVRLGKLPREFIGKFWIDISDNGIDAILPAIKVVDEERVLVDGIVYFREKKMVGRTTPIEIGAFMNMKGKNRGGYPLAVNDAESGVYLLRPLKRDAEIVVKLENGKPRATINVTIDAMVEEEIHAEKLSGNTIRKLEEQANKKLEQICVQLLNKFQEKGSDVIGLGARMRAKFAYYWETEIKTDEKWSEVYKDMDIKVNVDYIIKRTGMEWN